MRRISENEHELIAFGKYLSIREEPDHSYSFNCTEDEFKTVWYDYFDLGTDYEAIRAEISPEDEFLLNAASFGGGIRILRQDSFEMLISFIISQRKSVPAIRTSIERLCENFGERRSYIDKESRECYYHAFPTVKELYEADGEKLSGCGLGYRLPYIRAAAERVLSGAMHGLEKLSTEELIEALMEFQGVGIKVASCTALFGFHRLSVIPVDVWIKRVIDTVYEGQLPDFYGRYGGVYQQYLFNYARLTKLKG